MGVANMGVVKKARQAYSAFRQEVSRLASMANKRLHRLERNNLQDLPAYKTWFANGQKYFSVKGKNQDEIQREYWRLKHFLDNQTSTVRGANNFLREMAKNTGIKYKGLTDLKTKAKKFFELAQKIEDYNKSINETARALDYQKIWNDISQYMSINKQEFDNIDDTEQLLEKFLQYLDKLQPVENNKEGYSYDGTKWEFIDL
jgi:hypothetical protein